MIIAYYRPETLAQALDLLSSPEVTTLPIGGGTTLDRLSLEPLAVVDLQVLRLNQVTQRGHFLEIGATATLQSLLDEAPLPSALQQAIQQETSYNLRHMATTAGALLSADGCSPFATAMLALDAQLTLQPGDEIIALGELLLNRQEKLPGRLVTRVVIPLNARLSYQMVARTPVDLPIVCLGAAIWPAGRTRLVVGGWGDSPHLAMDGPEPGGAEIAVAQACVQAEDEWATAVYRQEVAQVLTRRSLRELAA